MEDSKGQDDVSNKIKVFSSDDEKLKIFGELLSNKSSRDIIKLLIDKEMYTNEIAKKLELRVSLVIHHLKKMEELGLLEIKNKKIIRKGNEHRYFRMVPNLFISLNHTKDELKGKETFKKIFKEKIKIIMIPIGGIISWFLTSRTIFVENTLKYPRPQEFSNEFLSSLVISLLVIMGGLLIYLKFKK